MAGVGIQLHAVMPHSGSVDCQLRAFHPSSAGRWSTTHRSARSSRIGVFDAMIFSSAFKHVKDSEDLDVEVWPSCTAERLCSTAGPALPCTADTVVHGSRCGAGPGGRWLPCTSMRLYRATGGCSFASESMVECLGVTSFYVYHMGVRAERSGVSWGTHGLCSIYFTERRHATASRV